MNRQDCTGEDVLFRPENSKPVSLAYELVSGERWAQGIETAGSQSTGESQRRSNTTLVKKMPILSRRVPYKVLQIRRQYIQSCVEELERVQNSGDDPVAKSNCLTHVKDHLQSLWELVEGDSDSEAFEEIVNVLQIAFCDESQDALTLNQLSVLKSVLVEIYNDIDIDDQTANDLTQELIRGGIDVFREIG